jgi:hypothetical protein
MRLPRFVPVVALLTAIPPLYAARPVSAGIQVALAGVMRCDPGDQNIRAGQSERV